MRSLLYLKLTFFLILGANTLFANKLNDRILFTIGSQAHSQQEMQLYLRVKLALKGNKKTTSLQKQFNKLFFVFLDDMIIHSQSTKIFDANYEEKQKSNIQIAKRVSATKVFTKNALNVHLPQEKILNIINIIQATEIYRKTQNSSKPKKTWLNELKQKSDFRIFKDAKTYKQISPL